jgi:cytochrome c oxidase subunit II
MKNFSSLLSSLLLNAGLKAAAVGSALVATVAHAAKDLPGGPAVNQLNFHPAVTKIAEDQAWLHWFMMIACTVIFIAVFGVMFYSILKHRKSLGHKAANFHESVTVEIIWTIVPFVIVIAMGLLATKTLVATKDTTNAELTIKATGYQWKWGYDYIKGEGEGLGFISTLDNSHRVMSNAGSKDVASYPDNYLLKVDNPLVVPVGKKIRIITTANDVIHAFAVPAFGIKQDAIPGFVRDTWFKAEKTGDFYGQCQELCGKEHAYMPIHVKVVTAAEYSVWVAAQQKLAAAKQDDPTKVWAMADIMKRGERAYASNCAACHQASGKGAGPIKPIDGAAVVLDSDKNKQIKILLNGQNNGAMPAWKQLSDTDIAAIITYTKNSWSNKTGQLVQPSDVLAARK